MAGNGELERVLRTGVADGSHCFWGADRTSDLEEGRCPRKRNFAHRAPHSALKIRAANIQRERKVSARVLDKVDRRLDHFSGPRVIMLKLRAREARLQSGDKLFIAWMLLDEDRDDPLVRER
jgi:hypothetical protein